ncbi:MAG: hypothetical protein ACXVDK_17510 [Bacteroidia bacterium]
MTILVFKTSVQNKEEVVQLQPLLNSLVLPSGSWNFDLEDCDRILRVETSSVHPNELISAVKNEGFDCAELAD